MYNLPYDYARCGGKKDEERTKLEAEMKALQEKIAKLK